MFSSFILLDFEFFAIISYDAFKTSKSNITLVTLSKLKIFLLAVIFCYLYMFSIVLFFVVHEKVFNGSKVSLFVAYKSSARLLHSYDKAERITQAESLDKITYRLK